MASMSLPPPKFESFKRRLRLAAIEAGFVRTTRLGEPILDDTGSQQVNVYRLARHIDPENPWVAERNLRRWLDPRAKTLPSRASRDALARVLGRDPDFFDPKPGVSELREIAAAYSMAELLETRVMRKVWATHEGHYLEPAVKPLVRA